MKPFIGEPDEVITSPSDRVARYASYGRWLLLLVLAGHLVFRREFAHRNLGDLMSLVGMTPPQFLSQAYVTEIVLLLLIPIAALVIWHRIIRPTPLPPGSAMLQYGLGAGVFLAAAFLLWGFWHAISAANAGGDGYLIVRQSFMCAYAVFFIYAFLFFGDQAKFLQQAALFTIAVAVFCAVADSFGVLKPRTIDPNYPDEPLFGQETLPIAILGLSLFLITVPNWYLAAPAAIALVLVGWRQSARLPQSVVPIAIAGAVVSYLLMAGLAIIRGQTYTLKRAILLVALFVVVFVGLRSFKKIDPKKNSEVQAWSPQKYRNLFELYESTSVPADSTAYVNSARAPGTRVTDPEVYKLNAVYEAAQAFGGTSVVNNIWRLLMWRRMSHDWSSGRPMYGAGVGKAWAYNDTLYHTKFHYESDRGGLNPHNSYLNILYRFGAVGFGLLAATVLAVLFYAWRALRLRLYVGDVLLEGLLLYFFYTAVFSIFTVSLEGPSYALPFWISLGLVYARARQILSLYGEGLQYL